MADAPRRFGPRPAPQDLGRAYFATEERARSRFKFVAHTRRGRLRLDNGALVFESPGGPLILREVWSIEVRRQNFPWANFGLALGLVAVAALVAVLASGASVSMVALWPAGVGLAAGAAARAAKWVRIEYGDPSLPRQVAWFAPAGYAMYRATKRLHARLEEGMGVVAEAPDITPYGGRRAGSP